MFRSWNEVESVIEDGADMEIASAASLVACYDSEIFHILNDIEERSVGPEEADMNLSTAHSSKGLEWDDVTMLSGYLDINDHNTVMAAKKERTYDGETNLIYVAATRGKKKIKVSPEIVGRLETTSEGQGILNRLNGGKAVVPLL